MTQDFFDHQFDLEHGYVHRFPSGLRTLAERYAERWVEIHVHFSLDAGEYCAVFYRPVVDEQVAEQLRLRGNQPSEFNRGSDKVEVAVLLDVSKTIEQEKETIGTIRIPSLARLQFIDDCSDFAFHSGDRPIAVLMDCAGRLFTDREPRVLSGLISALDDQLPGEMIEGGPKVKEGITEAQGNAARRSERLTDDVPSVIESLSVEIVNNYARLRLAEAESVNVVPKGVQVLVRPYVLGLMPVGDRHDVYSGRYNSRAACFPFATFSRGASANGDTWGGISTRLPFSTSAIVRICRRG